MENEVAIPIGYLDLSEVRERLLAASLERHSDQIKRLENVDGADEGLRELFEHLEESNYSELWQLVASGHVEAISPNGGRLRLKREALLDGRQVRRAAGHFDMLSNNCIDIGTGEVISGQFSGCMLAVSEKYLITLLHRKKEAKPNGRPSTQAKVLEAYTRNYPNGHEAARVSWKVAAARCDAHERTLKRALGRK